MPKRLATKLTAQGERVLRSGHPWLFDGAIASVKGAGGARPGDFAIIFDRRRDRFIGVGLYDPTSPIRIRVLHQGEPRRIDANFFAERVHTARKRREPLLADSQTDGYRLLHGENDGMPGLVVDVYAGVAVLKLYTAAWLPYLDGLLPVVVDVSGATTVVGRAARVLSDVNFADGGALIGELPKAEVVFREHGLRFYADVVYGHKTGFFLDHRHNRRRVGELAAGREVLDVFSYAGGFSVHALAGGARRVVSVDVSAPALAAARRNSALNNDGEPDPRYETIADDAFAVLEDLDRRGDRFGLVIVDPPSFAKRESEVAGALAAYRRINALAVRLVAPGGTLLTASCSARVSREDFFRTVGQVLHRSGRTYVEQARTYHDIDHPIGFPEGAYLKASYYRID